MATGTLPFTDLIVRDRASRVRLWVEVTRLPGLAASEATERRFWRLEELPQKAPFLLVTPRVAYLWSVGAPDTSLPEQSVDMREELAPYFERTHIDPEAVQPIAFRMIVSSWLSDVLDRAGPWRPSWSWLEQAGVEPLPGGEIMVGDAA